MHHNYELQVEAIKHGTVIDHIPEHLGFKLLTLFRLTEIRQRITIGLNLPSGEMVKKDLIKIENVFLNDNQINQLAIYAPCATVNLIENYKVVAKIGPTLPKFIERVLSCPNTNCISNNNWVISSFNVQKNKETIYLICKYCEQQFSHNIVLEC